MRYFVKKVSTGYWVGYAVGNDTAQGTTVSTKEEASKLIKDWKLENSLGVK